MNIPNPHIFRTYDIRGHAENDFPSAFVVALGKAMGTCFHRKKKINVVISRDCRTSSDRLRNDLLEGLLQTGIHVLDIGVAPTPLMYFAVHQKKLDGGIQITGSHNPAEQNGFKIMLGTEPFFGSSIEELKQRIEQEDYFLKEGGQVLEASLDNDYLDFLAEDIRIKNPSLRFAVDAGNGASGPLAVLAFHRLGLQPKALLCDHDGTFPVHHPDPSNPQNMALLQDTILAEGLDFGIAWDGDGDRIGVVTRQGHIVHSDLLALFFGLYLLKEHPGATMMGDVKCSQLFFDGIRQAGGNPVMCKTGHSLIKEQMPSLGAIFAGEMSGHLFFADDRFFGFDDGLYAALRLVEILCQNPEGLDAFLENLPARVSTPEIRFFAQDSHKHQLVEMFSNVHRNDSGAVLLDGARISMENGWGLVRASNTEPAIVIRLEATDISSLQKNQQILENELEMLKEECLKS